MDESAIPPPDELADIRQRLGYYAGTSWVRYPVVVRGVVGHRRGRVWVCPHLHEGVIPFGGEWDNQPHEERALDCARVEIGRLARGAPASFGSWWNPI
jgi:hypothetical protein